MTDGATHRAIEAVWRIESARIIAGLARMVRDVALAEDLAQEALVAALERWPETGVPDNPGAWLMTAAKRRAIDLLRRGTMAARKHEELGHEVEARLEAVAESLDDAIDDPVGDDLLRLIFVACHPVLATEARVALTLRLLGGLTTPEIARAFLVPEATVAQRIVRAKRTLAATRVPFEVPRGAELAARLASVLEVIYLVFNEGYAATGGDDWIRPALCEEAARLGRILAELAPHEPEVHGLVALMEIQASRAGARIGEAGEPVLLLDQDRGRWDRLLIRRGLAALARAEALGGDARPLRAAGRDRRLSRPRAHRGGNGLGTDLGALRRARRDRAVARGRAEPGGGASDGVRPGSGPRARRRPGRGALAGGVPPAPERARLSPRQARPSRRGARGVRARGLAHAQRARAHASPRPRRRLCPWLAAAVALTPLGRAGGQLAGSPWTMKATGRAGALAGPGHAWRDDRAPVRGQAGGGARLPPGTGGAPKAFGGTF